MKKPILALLVLILVAAGFFIFTGSDATDVVKNTVDKIKDSTSSSNDSPSSSDSQDGTSSDSVSTSNKSNSSENEGFDDDEDRPAALVYSSAEEALTAVQGAAKEYDDIILEQFVEPGKDCTWCDSFYESLTTNMKQTDITEDERAYYSEILAISGNPKHIQTLIDSITESGDSEDADIYAESLELTIGGDDTVKLLAEYIESDNELLQESAVAAITNQGSRFAAETLYEHTQKAGDPDGYYSLGIGLSEMIPEQEALPFFEEIASKRDEYSHHGIKALLNYGHEGLVKTIDILVNSDNPEFDKGMLVDAADHISFEEESEAYLLEVKKTHADKAHVIDFVDEAIEIYALDKELEDDDEDLDEE